MSFSLTVGAQKNPFDDLKYDRVVAFEFYGIGNRTIDRILVEDQTKIDNQIILHSLQTNEFEEIITKKGAYNQGTAACFDPHFAIVYYLCDSIVAKVDVCLSCNYLISSEKIPSVYQTVID